MNFEFTNVDACPECGGTVRSDDKLTDDDSRVATGRKSGETAECVIVRCCKIRVVPTSNGLEKVDLDEGWS